MKLPCEIVRDLLPLYQDGLCSPGSRQAVEEHLKQCPDCAGKMRLLNLSQELGAEEAPEEAGEKERRSSGVFRKIRRRWALSLVAVLLILPLLGLGAMGWNQYRGEGICFTNLDELWLCRRFLWLVQKGRYEEATELMDFDQDYVDILDCLSWTVEDYESQFQKVTLCGETYMAQSWFAEQYLGDNPTEDADESWRYLIYKDIPQILIPLEVWQRITGSSLETDGAGRQTGIQPESGTVYCLWESPWGPFMVEESDWENVTPLETAPEELCATLNLVPEELYQEAKPAMDQSALEACTYNQERFGTVRDMTREEFCAYMRQQMARSIGEAMAGVTFSNVDYKGAYYLDGRWDVEYSLTAETASGERGRLTFYFMVTGGISAIGGSCPEGSDTLRSVHDAFHICFGE